MRSKAKLGRNHVYISDSVQSNHAHSESLSLPISNVIPLRKSSKVHKPPTYLRDYHCNLIAAPVSASASLSPSYSFASSPGILYPFSSSLSYAKLSNHHKAFSIAFTIH